MLKCFGIFGAKTEIFAHSGNRKQSPLKTAVVGKEKQ